VLAAATFARPGPADEAPPRYAIRAGKIVTVTRGVIDHGLLLVSEGKIEALGPEGKVAAPEGYEVIDVGDRWIMPGMVEIHSHCGVGWGINDMVSQINPGMRVGDDVDPDAVAIPAVLAAGVTTVQSVPGSGTNHGGYGVAFKTWGATKQDRIIRRISIMKMTQAYNPERPGGDIGASRMGMAWLIRQYLNSARDYERSWEAYQQGERKAPPETNLGLEFSRPVMRGELPVLIHTYESWGVGMTTHMFADEYGLKGIATHAEWTGHNVGEAVARKHFGINVGPGVVSFTPVGDGRVHSVVVEFVKRGVEQISVNTDAFGFDQAYLAGQAAMAARLGLDDQTALKLVTINPASAILLGDRLGSLEVGKDADLVVKRSSLLDPSTPVEMVFVNGRLAYRRDAKH
jgi:imidazolonepropionase-like amidohydrolase